MLFKKWLNRVFGVAEQPKTVYFVDATGLYQKNGYLHIPKNLMIKFPSLAERIRCIPFETLNDDLLFWVWEQALNEMNRRKAKRGQNENR